MVRSMNEKMMGESEELGRLLDKVKNKTEERPSGLGEVELSGENKKEISITNRGLPFLLRY
jgi:hypothetical protein